MTSPPNPQLESPRRTGRVRGDMPGSLPSPGLHEGGPADFTPEGRASGPRRPPRPSEPHKSFHSPEPQRSTKQAPLRAAPSRGARLPQPAQGGKTCRPRRSLALQARSPDGLNGPKALRDVPVHGGPQGIPALRPGGPEIPPRGASAERARAPACRVRQPSRVRGVPLRRA
jgi:hypothetical protein